jgi:hypothetical protein
MEDSTAKPVWAPFHKPRKELNCPIERNCLNNCACPRCEGVLRSRFFFITHWSSQKYDTKTLAQTYEDRLHSWLPRRFRRLLRRSHASVIGCMSEFSDYFSRTKVFVYSSLVLLPHDIEWSRPWVKMLISAGQGPHYTFNGDVSFQEWAAVSSCPLELNDPLMSPVRFYWAALHQLYWSDETENGVVKEQYGDRNRFRERMISTFPHLDKTFFSSCPDMAGRRKFAQDHLHSEWVPGKGKHSVWSTDPKNARLHSTSGRALGRRTQNQT